MTDAKKIVVLSVAGYEVSLEVPAWVENLVQNYSSKYTIDRKLEATSYKLQARSDFFAPVWEGLEDRDGRRNSVHGLVSPLISFGGGGDTVGVGALPLAHPLQIRPSKRLEAQISTILGTVLVGLAVTVLVGLFGPIVIAEAQHGLSRWSVNRLPTAERQAAVVAQHVTFADYVAADPVLASVVPQSREFGVIIPKIEVNSQVVAEVDASRGEEYAEALKQGLAHAKGTALPGGKGDIFIFGHSTDYAWNVMDWNALFYNLKDLEKGDKVYLYYQGKPRIYQVTEKQVYEPKDVSFLHAQSGTERLVLQTCTPPGTTWKRLVVFAELLPQFVHSQEIDSIL